jgi:hypothetical protein
MKKKSSSNCFLNNWFWKHFAFLPWYSNSIRNEFQWWCVILLMQQKEKDYMSQEWIAFVNNNKHQRNCHMVRGCMLQKWIAFVNNKHQHNYHTVRGCMLQKWIAFVNNKHQHNYHMVRDCMLQKWIAFVNNKHYLW